jgi:hypothetical protein
MRITTHSVGLDGEIFEERREETRRRVLKGGSLRFNKGYCALECVVRNLSDNGAKLGFGETSAVPPHFDLSVSGDDRLRRAHVRWRTVTEIGVELTDRVEGPAV